MKDASTIAVSVVTRWCVSRPELNLLSLNHSFLLYWDIMLPGDGYLISFVSTVEISKMT
jgi:hypothetical protein